MALGHDSADPAAVPVHLEVPSWLSRLAAIGWRVLVTVAFGAFVVGFALYLSTVTFSILFAVIAVATLGPFNERLRARGWGVRRQRPDRSAPRS